MRSIRGNRREFPVYSVFSCSTDAVIRCSVRPSPAKGFAIGRRDEQAVSIQVAGGAAAGCV